MFAQLCRLRGWTIIDETHAMDRDNVPVFYSEWTMPLAVEAVEGLVRNTVEITPNTRIIIVSQTARVPKKLALLASIYPIEFLYKPILSVLLNGHMFLPKSCRLVTPEEHQEIHDQYGTQLMQMLATDALSILYGFKRMDIVAIERRNGFIVYRKIV